MTDQDKKNTFSVKFTKWILENRLKVILLSIVVSFAFASGARFLGFSNNYRIFFGEDNPQLLAFEEVENTYTKNDNVLFILTPKSGNVFEPQTIQAVQELTSWAWKVPYSTRVDSISNFQHTTAKGDDLFVDDLIGKPGKDLTPAELAEIKKIAINEPILKNRVITDKANTTGVNVSIQLPGKDPNEVFEVSDYSRELTAKFKEAFPGIEIRLSGMQMMNNAFAEAGQNDAATLTPLMYLIMLIIMAFLIRSVGGTIASLGVIILSTVAAMGFAGYAGIMLTPPSAIAPTIILTLAIADSVHVLVTMLYLMRKGWEKKAAIVESMRLNLQAVFLTSITTIVGFLCLNFSDAPPYHHLGNITAVGVLFAFLLSVTFLPALVSILPIRVAQTPPKTTRVFDSLAEFVIRCRTKILGVSVLIAIVLGAFVPQMDLNDEFVKWFDHRVDFRRDTDYMIENLTGIYQFEYSISSGEEEGISQPEFLSKVQAFTDWWRAKPEVLNVVTYTDIMKKLNQTMHGDDPAWYRLPEDTDLAAQYLLLYEMSLPFGLDLNNQINIDKSSVRISVILEELTTKHARALSAEGDQWLKENTPEVMHARATGPSIMFSHISSRNIQSMIKGTILAFALITLLMILALGSLKYGLWSLIPNVIPALMAFGLWSVLFQQAGMAISIVGSATLGIIVDDSVHFLTKYLRARREEGKNVEDAIRYAFSSVGLAIVITSVVLAIGFLIMTTSVFHLNWALGMMSAFTIVFALLVDFFFLPAFLLCFDRKGTISKPKPAPRRESFQEASL